MQGRSVHGHKHPQQESAHRGEHSKHRPAQAKSRVLSIGKRRGPVDRDLEGLLSSAMLVSDKELSNVIHEVEQISKALKVNDGASELLRSAVHPAVWFAVKHVIMERELRHLALTDDLTCFYNRRGFFASATQQIKLARRNGHGMLLFFCDLDNLKDINDSFGHREGDHALVRAADALEEVFRDSDILARLGGDEFAALAFEASKSHEAGILRRLDENLQKASQQDPRYILSLSVGVARFDPAENTNLADLMAQADRAMYERKRTKQRLFSKNA
jgi:diguanylate cyclase (GGDEF)-like protein